MIELPLTHSKKYWFKLPRIFFDSTDDEEYCSFFKIDKYLKGSLHSMIFSKYTELLQQKNIFRIFWNYFWNMSYSQIFVNQSFCPYYKSLWPKSKKLSSLGKINSFFISNSIIKIKLQENSNPESITHSSDFFKFSQMLIYPHHINKSS